MGPEIESASRTAVLLERDESLASLDRLLAAVRDGGKGRLVLVGGEAGVGKTTLLRRFCATHAGSSRILRGACQPLRTARPLGPLVDVAEATGGELEELVAAPARAHEVAAALLGELRRRTATVLVLEDVHWADEATLDVVTLLAARVDSTLALVIASYRDDERDHSGSFRLVLGELARGPSRVKLRPLSSRAVAELAAPHGIDGEELHRRTGGNPFFVTEALASHGERIPDTVRDAVLARAGRLSPAGRRLLEVVATSPGQIEWWLLEELAGDLVEHLEECVAGGMLSAGRADVAFRHELARLAIDEAMVPNRRVSLHRRALAVSAGHADADRDAARLAYHADAAADPEAVLRWAPRAAVQAASSGAHREAAAHYARALEFADRLEPGARAGLLEGLAHECWITDEFDRAITAQREALACYRRLGDRLGEGRAVRILARLLGLANRFREAQPLGLEAVELLERLPAGHELAMAYAVVAEDRFVYHDTAGAVRWGTRALELAARLDDTEARVWALENMGVAEYQMGLEQGRVKLEQALALAQDKGLDNYVARAYILLLRCCMRLRRLGSALRYLDLGLPYCRERGLDTWRLYLLASRARVEASLGNWNEATEAAELALRDVRSSPSARVWAQAALGIVRVRRGDPGATGLLEEAHAEVDDTGQLEWVTLVAGARAEAAWLNGDRTGVAAVTEGPLALALEDGEPWSIAELGYWRWKAGVRDELPEPTAGAGEPYRLSMAGDWSAAAERWQGLGYPYEAALALADGEDEDSVREAIERLQQLGARPAAAITARGLREQGVRGIPRGPRPRTRENPVGLTARQLEVLRLLVQGLRNAEIAARLVVSEKTVDHHVSAILGKLGVHTRGEAAAQASRLGITLED